VGGASAKKGEREVNMGTHSLRRKKEGSKTRQRREETWGIDKGDGGEKRQAAKKRCDEKKRRPVITRLGRPGLLLTGIDEKKKTRRRRKEKRKGRQTSPANRKKGSMEYRFSLEDSTRADQEGA